MTDRLFDLFNDTILQFLNDICIVACNIKNVNTNILVTEINKAKKALLLLKSLNNKQLQKYFSQFLAENNDIYYKLKDKDESLFNQKEIQTLLDKNLQDIPIESYWNTYIENIGNIWSELSLDDKQNVWRYFSVLINLNNKITSI